MKVKYEILTIGQASDILHPDPIHQLVGSVQLRYKTHLIREYIHQEYQYRLRGTEENIARILGDLANNKKGLTKAQEDEKKSKRKGSLKLAGLRRKALSRLSSSGF